MTMASGDSEGTFGGTSSDARSNPEVIGSPSTAALQTRFLREHVPAVGAGAKRALEGPGWTAIAAIPSTVLGPTFHLGQFQLNLASSIVKGETL